ncbi:MAG: four helix bundle suffix domain-containing protein [Bacteroides sp.]|nr:four helix bundle suffix domain-containing protein [Bacteroides sp.]
MGVEIKFSQSYFWLNSWILANIIQLGTQSFCDRFVNCRIDPGRRLYDQMALAARCGVANIAEGSARHSTSIETEMRLLDVARASFDELQGDYFNFLLRQKADVWAIGNPHREALWKVELDSPRYSNSLLHDAASHILRHKSKYDPWIESESLEIATNAMLILCVRINRMLQSQLQGLLDMFRRQGGFTENMTAERLEARRTQAQATNAPACPKCGKPMLRRMQNKGQMQGREFWGCSDYPRCNGTRPAN